MIGARNTATRPTHRHWQLHDAAGRDDAYYLVRQWSHYFGVNYGPHELPIELCTVAGWDVEDAPDALGTVATHTPIDREGSVPVGAGLVSVHNHDEAIELLPEGRFDADALVGDRTAWLWFGVVDPEWRGRGIGRAMFDRRVEWAREQGASMAVAFGWERSGTLPSSRPLFESDGWIPIQRFESHYAENRDACPDCECWPSNDVNCDCEMTLWAVDLA